MHWLHLLDFSPLCVFKCLILYGVFGYYIESGPACLMGQNLCNLPIIVVVFPVISDPSHVYQKYSLGDERDDNEFIDVTLASEDDQLNEATS